MIYQTYKHLTKTLQSTPRYYRTVSKSNRILEYWFNKSDVQPTEDYHKIQYVLKGKVFSSWNSLYDFYNLPF